MVRSPMTIWPYLITVFASDDDNFSGWPGDDTATEKSPLLAQMRSTSPLLCFKVQPVGVVMPVISSYR